VAEGEVRHIVSGDAAVRPVVTISASYGAGGSQVGPGLARRLGVPFVDRAIPTTVAARLDVPLEEAVAHEELARGSVSQLIGHFGPLVQMFAGAPLFPEMLGPDDQTFVAETERVLRGEAAHGAVILGRGAAVVLRDVPGVLHVRLDGPPERRVTQAMAIEGLDRVAAERMLRTADLSREAYVRHWYDVDPRDPALYHLVVDSTQIALDACIEVIAVTWESSRR
jgi:cytidylate kinase